jgi:hypothetical protein
MKRMDDDPFADLAPATQSPRHEENVVPFPVPPEDRFPPREAYENEFIEPPPKPLEAAWPTTYDFFDERALQPRQWVYGQHYLRKFVSVLASAGGIGKTSLQIVEALAICTGKPLLGETVHQPCNVWLVNLEDPIDEMQRRILAAMKQYEIEPHEIRGKFFVDAGRDFSMSFASQSREGVLPNLALVDHLLRRIPELQIGAVFIDPFVGAHQINENDNMAVNAVVGQIRKVADETNCAIGLVHHIRKGNGEDATIDSVRGAGSLIGAARAARVINRISQEDAEKYGIEPLVAKSVFRVDDGKANLAPPAEAAQYRRMEGVKLLNGEWVGVATVYTLPEAFSGVRVQDLLSVQNEVWRRCEAGRPPRYSDKAGHDWVGHIIAEILSLDAQDDKRRINKLLSEWIKNGALNKADLPDEHRKNRPCVEVGEWATI